MDAKPAHIHILPDAKLHICHNPILVPFHLVSGGVEAGGYSELAFAELVYKRNHVKTLPIITVDSVNFLIDL